MAPHPARRDRLRELMAATDCEALLVTGGPDVRYLSGFSGSNGALLILAETAILATDGRYRVQAGREAPDLELIVTRHLFTDLLTAAADRGLRQVGFDPARLSVAGWRQAGEEVPSIALEPAQVDVAGLRAVKDDEEIALLRQACAISVQALGGLLDEVRPGMTELGLARRLELLMGEAGAADRAFDSIVAAGPHSAIPHHQPTTRPIAAGDLLKIDFGALFDGYHSDCTRTFVVAAEPLDWQTQIHEVVLAAQKAGIAALGPGASGQQVDVAAREVIEAAGFGQYYSHGLGHGVGLQIHEAPFLGPTSTHTVEARTPLTVEPGVYLPDRGGVRIEDTVLVLDGSVEILTDFPRDLARVG